MIVQISPVLPDDARQQALALAEAGMLGRLVTSWVPRKQSDGPMWRLPGLRWLARRRPAPVDASCLHRVVAGDVVYWTTRSVGRSAVEAVDRRCSVVDRAARHWVRPPVRLVLAREDGCLASFERAAASGIRRVYDLPTAHHATVRPLLCRELDQFPDICTASGDPREFSDERAARKDAELVLAEHILCPSGFVRDSLLAAGVGLERIRVLPFAGEPAWVSAPALPARDNLFLFVGQISLRKGVHRLLSAWKRLKAYHTHRLRLVGAMRLSDRFLREFSGLYEHVPPVRPDALPAHYAQAQALVLNSMAEGLAMVVPQSMSCGTPVLSSRNSGADGFIGDGAEGRLFPFGDDDALMAVLDWALSHPGDLAEMGRRARDRIAAWLWPDYRRVFVGWIRDVAGGRDLA